MTQSTKASILFLVPIHRRRKLLGIYATDALSWLSHLQCLLYVDESSVRLCLCLRLRLHLHLHLHLHLASSN